MALTLVVLAAGMGSRYGGLKQIDPVGPGGETVLDYAVFDAIRAGFDRVLFVIRRDFEARFRETIGARYAGRVTVDYAFQAPEALPPGFRPPAGREKPWGTGHALWCARAAVPENFAVINADDFYGEDSFRQLANFLRGARGPEAAIVGFRLANTLSEHGAVSRGVCSSAGPGELASIVEQTGILPTEVGAGKKYSGQEIVSMNCWGFTSAIWVGLETQFLAFLAGLSVAGVDPLKAEFYLPAAVSALVARRELAVRILPTQSNWFGVTYREDKPRVEASLRELIAAGRYPARLWA
jgi:hypothetical protein